MSKWIRKDDKVVVITGNDKGKVGKVLGRRGDKILIQGINIRKKHIKKNQKSQGMNNIIDIETPIHISNVSFANSEGEPVKIKVRVNKNKERELYFLEKEQEVVLRTIQKAK